MRTLVKLNGLRHKHTPPLILFYIIWVIGVQTCFCMSKGPMVATSAK